MPQYMLILYEHPNQMGGTGGEAPSPEMIQAIIDKYNAWSGKLAAQGKLLGGDKLFENDRGRWLKKNKNEIVVTDGPFVETKEVIGGYFKIEATSYEEAVNLCRDCPHIELGGTIEVREVEQMPQ